MANGSILETFASLWRRATSSAGIESSSLAQASLPAGTIIFGLASFASSERTARCARNAASLCEALPKKRRSFAETVSLPGVKGRSLRRATAFRPEHDYREDQEKMSSLYDRLGGEKAVNAAVENFYRHVLADGRIARFFEGVDMDSQIAKQKSFLTMAFGGPNKYTGADMRNAHKKLVDKGLNDSHVDAVIENLNTTLRELGVPETEVKEVAAIANSVRSDVLGR